MSAIMERLFIHALEACVPGFCSVTSSLSERTHGFGQTNRSFVSLGNRANPDAYSLKEARDFKFRTSDE